MIFVEEVDEAPLDQCIVADPRSVLRIACGHLERPHVCWQVGNVGIPYRLSDMTSVLSSDVASRARDSA